MKIYILNDTSNGHAGSKACMQYIYKELRDHEIVGRHYCNSQEIIDMFEFHKADIVILNGEGTMHDKVPKALNYFDFLIYAKETGKKTMLVNSVWQNMHIKIPYYAIDYCCVREPYSHRDIKIEADIVPDFCIGAYEERYQAPMRTKKIAVGDTHPDVPWHGIFNYIKGDYVPLAETFQETIEILKEYDLYITGQHHGIYAAILAGTKFLSVPSNTWKIESLLAWIKDEDPKQFLLTKWNNFSLREKIENL